MFGDVDCLVIDRVHWHSGLSFKQGDILDILGDLAFDQHLQAIAATALTQSVKNE